MKPLEASLFKPLSEELKLQLLLSNVVPVNDSFLPFWNSTNKINLFYGSYGSGKSVFIVDRLLDKCINNKYFRGYFGRKIFETVRGTVFKTITDRIKELKKEHIFSFSDSPNGSMIITCKENGNEFYPFGANNPASLKSIKDPTDFFCEELDQFDFTDFGLIYSRLRTEKALTQFWAAFNTEKIYESHWIRKVFFEGEFADQSFKHKSTYRDNNFIDQEDYLQKLKLIANGDEATLNAIADAEWGVMSAINKFIFNFNRKKHICKGLEYIPYIDVLLSFDFNVEPITCLVGQCDGMERVRILDEYRLINSDIEELCTRIISDYPDRHLIVTGDASGQNRTALKRDLNYYKEIKRVLNLGIGQFKIPGSNPPIKNTRVLSNALLFRHNEYLFSDRVPYLIMDIEQCEVDETGGIDKSKDKHQSHLLDCWRYFNWTFLSKFLDLRIYHEDTNIPGSTA